MIFNMENNETYAMEGELVFVSYKPEQLEKGMYFVHTITVGVIEPITELFQLEEIPEDQEAYMAQYGAPVKLMIMNTFDSDVLVYPDQIGWYDDEEEMLDAVPISLEHLNTIINKCNGICWVDIYEDDTVTLHEGKAIISFELPEEN